MTEYSIIGHIKKSAETIEKMENFAPKILSIAIDLVECLRRGGTVFWFGNGGSASDAEHLAAELSGRFAIDRAPLDSLALTCNSSAVTAIANDYGFDQIFSRQVNAHVREGDVVIGISTSGSSTNVRNGLIAANRLGAVTILLTGLNYDGDLELNHTLSVPSANTANIQEAHITIGQAICGYVELEMVV
jgi:D-sedoheptulose 7-phosphate isomerase